MLDKIRKTIKKYRMIDKDETVVVCVSGGIDSVALLHILTGLREEYKLSIIAAHINHRLRGRESDRDEEFVRQLAHNFNVKFVGKRVDTAKFLKRGDSLQDVARQLRYRFFDEVAQRYNADRIATGHTMDDLAETMIMRFLRGTGLSGLSGIPPVRGKYIRPLIDISRQEIEKYVSIHGLNFVRDSSNKKVKYLRNRIRLKLMPVLKDYNPKLMTDLARL
ncbi:MAG: tRNA lysidine(34) synthetase TilS, partial [Deltaproteobacteria bacterium GWC2_42_51]